jgi:hypothetical protein
MRPFHPECYSSRVRKYRIPVEGFATNIALVWFLIGVDDLVSAECGRLPESFTTNFAHKRPGACTIKEIQFAEFNLEFSKGTSILDIASSKMSMRCFSYFKDHFYR